MKAIIQILLTLIIFLVSNSVLAQNTTGSYPDSLTFHHFGLPVLSHYTIKDSLANSMGFDYKFVAGCVLMPGQMEDIQEHNKQVRLRLNKLLGANWEEEFNREYNTLLAQE